MRTHIAAHRVRFTFGVAAIALVTALAMSGLVSGCKTSTSTTPAEVSGTVVYGAAAVPLPGALVRVMNHTETAMTDNSGHWSMSVMLNAADENLTFEATKPGYAAAQMTAYAREGESTVVPAIQLTTASGADSDSTNTPPPVDSEIGPPANLVLRLVSPPILGVHGAGEAENSVVCFGAVDAAGHHMDLAHKVTLEAWVTNPLDPDMKLTPDEAETDAGGNAIFVLQSGTVAGVAQIKCRVKGTTITSSPVAVVIHGGLPDDVHFSIAPELVNIPGRVKYGLFDRITAFVGDRYANPVRPGAGVYFTSSAGIIQGASFANEVGQAPVLLESAAPDPPTGFVTVTGRTNDYLEDPIDATCTVLFSGPTQLDVEPTTFDLAKDESQDFLVTLRDDLGHPLAGGTSIGVTATKGTVSGDASVTVPDTQSPGWTQFYVALTNDSTAAQTARPIPRSKDGIPLITVNMHPTLASSAPADRSRTARLAPASVSGRGVADPASAVSMTISVASPNGNAQITVRGVFR